MKPTVENTRRSIVEITGRDMAPSILRILALRLTPSIPWSLWRCKDCGSVLCCTSYPLRRERTECKFCKYGEDCRACNSEPWVDLRSSKREGES